MKEAFIHANILDGTKEMKLQEDMCIVVENHRIISIQKEIPDCKIIDLKGKYVLPGLINLHVHLPASGKPSQTKGDLPKLIQTLSKFRLGRYYMKKMTKQNAQMELYSGVTTLRSVGGLLDCDSKVRDEIKAGKYDGPRILASNMAISVPGGHMAGSLAIPVTTKEEAIACVRRLADEKVDLIKLMITGGVLDADDEGTPGAIKMSPEIVKAACDEAHRLGFQVAAHVECKEGIRLALKNGVDTIEHGSFVDDEIIALFKERNATIVTTLSPAIPALFDPDKSGISDLFIKNTKIVLNGMIDCTKHALNGEYQVGMGTDVGCPYITHYDSWREVSHFITYLHTTPELAIHIATLQNAKVVGLDHEIGSIEEGKIADMIVCNENPLENIKTLSELYMVIKDGKIIQNRKYKRHQEYDALFNTLEES